MKISDGIKVFKFSIEKVWKMVFLKCVGSMKTSCAPLVSFISFDFFSVLQLLPVV